jgi:hypothetical protein
MLQIRAAKVFDTLRAELLRNCAACASGSSPIHDRVRLWALCLGSIWELQCEMPASGASWFMEQLRKKMIVGEIDRGGEVKRNAEVFLKMPAKQQIGRLWFLGMIVE